MVNSRWFRNTTFILFMNKVGLFHAFQRNASKVNFGLQLDLFEEKLARHPLQVRFLSTATS
jgi:hypothetical protein